MSMRRTHFTNLKGKQVEFSVELIKPEDRHFHREARSHKNQIKSDHVIERKDKKIPIKRKMT